MRRQSNSLRMSRGCQGIRTCSADKKCWRWSESISIWLQTLAIVREAAIENVRWPESVGVRRRRDSAIDHRANFRDIFCRNASPIHGIYERRKNRYAEYVKRKAVPGQFLPLTQAVNLNVGFRNELPSMQHAATSAIPKRYPDW
jgi:hypothetical protein